MKVLVIMGSPHRGNTYGACEEFKEHVQKGCGAEFEYVWLKDIDMRPCTGCYVCFQHGEAKCPHQDDIRSIVKKMDEADGVVFASPVYSNNVSGLMKAFIDRISYNGHRPRFFGKKAFFISTTGMFGTKKVLRYMSSVAGGWWGFDVVGRVGVVMKNGAMPRDHIELNSRLLAKAARKYSRALLLNKARRPTLKDVVVFHWARGAISQLEEVSPVDYRYWKEKGWLSKDAKYCIDVPVNPLYVAIGKLFETLQRNKTKKEMSLASARAALPNQRSSNWE
jgi:multimeric flavodoxin WrbA